MYLITSGSFSCFSPNWHAALRCLLLTEEGRSVTGPSQSVEITSRKWFSDNGCVQATLSHGCKERPLRSKAAWAHHAPTPTCSVRDTAGAAKAGGVLREQPEARGPGPFPLHKQGAEALTHWVCQEEALRGLSAEYIPAAGGDCLPTEQCPEKWQLRQNRLTAQTTCSALRMQLGLAASPTGPLTYISFLQMRPHTETAFRCNSSKGRWDKEAVSWRGTKRKVWFLVQCHPWDTCPSFSDGKQGREQFPTPPSMRAINLHRCNPSSPNDWQKLRIRRKNILILPTSWVTYTMFSPSLNYFRCSLRS